MNSLERLGWDWDKLKYSLKHLSLLYLRVVLAIMFIDSGRRHMMDPVGRSKMIDLSPTSTFILGTVEVLGALSILLGYYAQYGAFFLSGIMVGAIFFKVFLWKTGMYGDKGNGWYYDALLLAGTGILFTHGAGNISVQ